MFSLSFRERKILILICLLILGGGILRLVRKTGASEMNHKYSEVLMPQKNRQEGLLININTASPEQLISLPGVGQILALRIIDYREKYGFFNNVDDLKRVKGIGEQKARNISDFIKFK